MARSIQRQVKLGDSEQDPPHPMYTCYYLLTPALITVTPCSSTGVLVFKLRSIYQAHPGQQIRT